MKVKQLRAILERAAGLSLGTDASDVQLALAKLSDALKSRDGEDTVKVLKYVKERREMRGKSSLCPSTAANLGHPQTS